MLVGFTDLVAGLTAAALALLGGLAYTEWGVVAIAVGATIAVVVPAIAIFVPPAARAGARTGWTSEGRLAAPLTASTCSRSYFVNWKLAECVVSSFSLTSRRKHFPAHALSVFQT